MHTRATLVPTQGQAETPWGWSRHFRMPLFKPGTRVKRGANWETVSHVVLRRRDLAVYLVGHADPVDPQELALEPTVFTTVRVPEQ